MRLELNGRLERLGQRGPGAWLARQWLRLAPRSGPLHRALMQHHRTHGRLERVVEHGRAALAADPADARATLLLGHALQRLHRHAEVVELLHGLARSRPELAEAAERLGRSLVALERYDEALPHLLRARCGARDPVRVLLDLARASLGCGHVEAHRRWCREARTRLAGRCRNADDWMRLVDVEFELGREGRPTEVLVAALQALPRDRARDAELLLRLGSVGPLPPGVLPLADALGAEGDAALRWIAGASRLLHAQRGEEAAGLLRALAPVEREAHAWSALMRAADPAHFAELAPPRRARAALGGGDLAAVVSFFDAGVSDARLRNFELFHQSFARAGVPLLVVELAFGERPFRLGGLPDVLQVRGGDLMFQRERLFNLGIARLLDRGFQKLLWVDADVVFEGDDWPQRISRKLDDALLCQAFDRAYLHQLEGDAGSYVPGELSLAASERARSPTGWLGLSGLAWAARAELLTEVPLYDAEIGGNGDLLLLAAAWPEPRPPRAQAIWELATHRMPAGLRSHYERWARAWSARVARRVGFADGFVQTLFHGPRRARRYGARADVLRAHDFSPLADLAVDAGGAWRWASHKPGLHRAVAGFLGGEEGARARPPEAAA
jgi:tetratricopeptide (TPR) repeat protein